MKDYKNEIEREIAGFRRQVERIESSDHPRYNVEGARQYEIQEARRELDAKVDGLRREHAATMESEIENARKAALRSRFPVSNADKEAVEYLAKSFIADAKLAFSDVEKKLAYDALERKLQTLNVGAWAHFRLQLPAIFDALGGDEAIARHLRSLNMTLSRLKTPEQERLEELEAQQFAGVDLAYRRLKITHSAYADSRDNQNYGRA
ncbi:hypothetical protein [Indiicoccus explosivorum]|uniref:hypothetical protein n=1 Tax=Indiicoccus explosivorum TaxID=1917864 RepID=UPI000B450447|nr:hypothetical protein [Indiicoccus explosivorum]